MIAALWWLVVLFCWAVGAVMLGKDGLAILGRYPIKGHGDDCSCVGCEPPDWGKLRLYFDEAGELAVRNRTEAELQPPDTSQAGCAKEDER